MTKEYALERIAKAQETISKKQNTITKKEAQIQKKIAELNKKGFTYTGNRVYTDELEKQGFSREEAWDIYWLQCDISSLEDDIERGKREIAEKEEKLPEYQKALAEAEQRERIIANDIPESMKKAKEELVLSWTLYDIRVRDKMREDRRNLPYREFTKRWKYTMVDSLDKTDEELKKINEKEATAWLIDLYNRVKDITGDIIDAENIHWGGKALDGWIVGKNGTADVFTIEAGGYNIQRWHLRVLVKRR